MEKMKEENTKEKKELKKKTALHKFALKETQKKLKELFVNVYKPLEKEVEVKDQIIKNQTSKAKQMRTELSILNAIIRLPVMCSEFHKALRNKTSD